jgi:hypothetical protein
MMGKGLGKVPPDNTIRALSALGNQVKLSADD